MYQNTTFVRALVMQTSSGKCSPSEAAQVRAGGGAGAVSNAAVVDQGDLLLGCRWGLAHPVA